MDGLIALCAGFALIGLIAACVVTIGTIIRFINWLKRG